MVERGYQYCLRSTEWGITSWERADDRVWLHVIHAKAFDGSYPTHRTLDLSKFSAEALETVERMAARSREWVLMGLWPTRRNQVSKLLGKVCKTMFPRMQQEYTLHSLRYQFIANMKTIYSREEVVAMTGHIPLDGQAGHYGKKRVSWEASQIIEIPRPVEEQVIQVRKRLELLDERLLDKEQKKAAKRGPDLNHERARQEEEPGYDPED